MFTVEIAAKLADTLSHLQCIPTFHNADLLISDVAELLGFQVHCEMNANGRLIFSVHDTETFPHAQKSLKSRYNECYSYDIRETPASDKQIYPTTGTDSIYDIAPATITRLMRIENEFGGEIQTAIPVFIMRLGEEIEKWEKYFGRMAKNLGNLKQSVEEIYENCL